MVIMEGGGGWDEETGEMGVEGKAVRDKRMGLREDTPQLWR